MAVGATTHRWVLDHERVLEEPAKRASWYGDRPCRVFTHRELPPVPGADIRFVQGEPVTLGAGAPVLPRRLTGVLQLVDVQVVNNAFVEVRHRLRRDGQQESAKQGRRDGPRLPAGGRPHGYVCRSPPSGRPVRLVPIWAGMEDKRVSDEFADRTAPSITSVGWVHLRAGRLLAVRTRGRDRFYLPGGKPEPGEGHEQALVREVREELGVRLSEVRAAFTVASRAHGLARPTDLAMHCFFAESDGDGRPAREIDELRWLGPEDTEHAAPAVQEVMRRVLSDARGRQL
jgi:8-oxo-dGTP diphosphatase